MQAVSTPSPVKRSPPFLAFVKDQENRDTARAVAIRNGWSEGSVHYGDVRQAIVYLKEQAIPRMLLVEVPSADEAPELLDRLADVCTPDMRVIIAGSINEFSFYSWLKSIGIEHYLLQPFSEDDLQQALKRNGRETAHEEGGEDGQLIACMGARGGVGATTVVSNLAWLLAKEYQQPTVLVDMDPYFGTAAMAFDVQPGHGLCDALEKPDRIDALFLDRVLMQYDPNLSLLCAEASLQELLASSADCAVPLIAELRQKFRYILVDLPRIPTPLNRSLLGQADQVMLVSELSLLSLRDLLRMRDYLVQELKRPEPIVVANREGLASKGELKKPDFDKHYGRPVDIHLPCMMEAFAATNSGEMLLDTTRNSTALEALHRLAGRFLPEDAKPAEQKPPKLLTKLLRGHG